MYKVWPKELPIISQEYQKILAGLQQGTVHKSLISHFVGIYGHYDFTLVCDKQHAQLEKTVGEIKTLLDQVPPDQ